MEQPATRSVAASLKLILDGLQAAIAARIQDYPFTAEMVVFLWKRVNTVKNRFLALAALIEAGKSPRGRGSKPPKPRARKRPDTIRPPGINWRKWLPMGRFAWLCWLMQSLPNRFGAAQFAEPLRHLLGEPEMRTLLAATPKAGRLLAPLCFMLGIEASLLHPVLPTPPAPEIPMPELPTTEPGVAPSQDTGAPLALEARADAGNLLPEPGVAFFKRA